MTARSVLAMGIYLADRPHLADHVIRSLGSSRSWQIEQRWISIGSAPKTPEQGAVTVRTEQGLVPKFVLLNEELTKVDLGAYEYVVITDDDIQLPDGFVDQFLGITRRLGLALSQPARTESSYIDHPIVTRQRGAQARVTQFVEIGPVFCIHHTAFPWLFPFDPISPMGWGYENVWSFRMRAHGLKMGIIDACPVEHRMRPPLANYGWSKADAQRTELLRKEPHHPLDECYRVLQVFTSKDLPMDEVSRG
jgi:hypothetical protein